MQGEEKIFSYRDEVVSLMYHYDRVNGYEIVLDEYTYMVFGQGFWAETISQVVFERISEYIVNLIEVNRIPNLDDRVSKLLNNIGVQECDQSGEPMYSEEKLERLNSFIRYLYVYDLGL